MHVELKVVEGKQQGSVIPLNRKKFLIGREEDCHLRPNSELVSRHHCVFTIDDFTVRLRDLGSTNGTYINDVRASGQVVLKHGDRIKIGKLTFEIAISQPAVRSAAPQQAAPEAYVEPEPEPAPVYAEHEPTGVETIADFAIPSDPQEAAAAAQSPTGIYGGDTTMITPAAKPAAPAPKPVLEVRLPPPEETGAPAPAAPAAPAAPGQAPVAADPRSSAADIIRQYMQRRPR
jgi:predicted component of type VI protein secretion system